MPDSLAQLDATVSSRWSDWSVATTLETLTPRIVALAKDRLLDAIATSFEATRLAVPQVALRFIGASSGPATIIGMDRSATAIDAAFVNATLINGATHDDFLAKSHAGAVTVAAALAVGEACRASGADLLCAIVTGYELGARAYLGGPTMLPRFRASGVAGAIGAAAGAARVARLDATTTRHALGLAAMFASGFGEGFRHGTMDVKLNVGWAARSGVSAVELAQAGATSAPTVFEGPSGFFEAFAHTCEQAGRAIDGLGERLMIEDAVYKERPLCIFVQTPVQLAIDLMAQHAILPEDIESVTILAPPATLSNPGYTNVAPFATALSARISARFTVAAALLGHGLEAYGYFDHPDADALALADRIELLTPGDDEQAVTVTVRTRAGVWRASGLEMDTLRPDPDTTRAKFDRLTAHLPRERAHRIVDAVMRLDAGVDAVTLGCLLRD